MECRVVIAEVLGKNEAPNTWGSSQVNKSQSRKSVNRTKCHLDWINPCHGFTHGSNLLTHFPADFLPLAVCCWCKCSTFCVLKCFFGPFYARKQQRGGFCFTTVLTLQTVFVSYSNYLPANVALYKHLKCKSSQFGMGFYLI